MFRIVCIVRRRRGQGQSEVTCALSELHTAPPQNCASLAKHAAEETDSTQPPNANRQHLVPTGRASLTFKMRTYDDSFSGQKIYPGKVRFVIPPNNPFDEFPRPDRRPLQAAHSIKTIANANFIYKDVC